MIVAGEYGSSARYGGCIDTAGDRRTAGAFQSGCHLAYGAAFGERRDLVVHSHKLESLLPFFNNQDEDER